MVLVYNYSALKQTPVSKRAGRCTLCRGARLLLAEVASRNKEKKVSYLRCIKCEQVEIVEANSERPGLDCAAE